MMMYAAKCDVNYHQFYHFIIKAFVCDTPARAFIKRCTGHGGFFACERCEIKGKTVQGRRVYKGINYVERTNCELSSILPYSFNTYNTLVLTLQV